MTRKVAALAGVALGLAASCRFDPSYRDLPQGLTVACSEGVVECRGASLVRCVDGAPAVLDDCGARGQACAPAFLKCTPCLPDALACSGVDVLRCDAAGQTQAKVETCDADQGFSCRRGGCVQLCDEASRNRSNVGCEYWPVDLDNAVVPTGNAAIQQFAVILSNPQPDVVAKVTIEEDTAPVGTPPRPRVVANASIGIRHLEVFKLGPKEVDGSTPDAPNSGTHTALTRNAFRVRSNVPIVAYQFNPLENVNVFSNDATLLLPTAALNRTGSGHSYVIAGWPQTIARSDLASTNFGLDLRAFLTIVGTTERTSIKVKSAARIVPGGPLGEGVPRGGTFEATLEPFDVLNLETGDFHADFTGSTIDSSAPVVVYVGSEASDAPFFSTLPERACCADHLESQVTPVRAVGKRYAIGRMPNRSRAVAAAGGAIKPFDEPELYRIVAVGEGPTQLKSTLPGPYRTFTLDGQGANITIPAHQDFTLEADKPVLVAAVQVSQEAAGVHRGLPGGDPSFMFVPPTEQWRSDYVFLTPDKYGFDFVVITAPFGAGVFLDGLPVDGTVCEVAAGDGLDEAKRGAKNPPYLVYRCQLSYPVIGPTNNLLPGRQNDGVHRVQSDVPLGVLVYGFDAFVSYAYAGGTELVDTGVN